MEEVENVRDMHNDDIASDVQKACLLVRLEFT